MACAGPIVAVQEHCSAPTRPSAPQDPVMAWWNSLPSWTETSEKMQEVTKNLPSWNETSEKMQEVTKTLPSWNETADRVQEVSKTTVESVRKSTATTLRDTADRLEEASKSTAFKMREAAPWVGGEEALAQPCMEDLRKGDMVFRKGLPAEVVNVGQGGLIVRMEGANNEVSTECHHISLSVDASQQCLGVDVRVCIVGLQNRPELNGCHGSITEFCTDVQRWDIKLDSTSEVIRASSRNLSALVSHHSASSHSAGATQGLDIGMRVRLEGLQKRSDLNGKQGVLKFFSQEGRWQVKVDFSGEVIGVHPRNLSLHGVSA